MELKPSHFSVEIGVEGRVDALSERIDARVVKIEERLSSSKERSKHSRLMRAVRAGIFLASVAIASAIAQYKSVRYSVEEVKTGGGVEYLHEDSETTAWINYLSGRKELDPEIKLRFNKLLFLDLINSRTSRIVFSEEDEGKDIEAMSEEDFKTLINRTTWHSSRGTKMMSYDLFDSFFPKMTENADLYKTLWEIEELAGNPKIRIANEGAPLVVLKRKLLKEIPGGFFGKERAMYDPVNNIAYIEVPDEYNPGDSIEDFIAEAAHGVQMNVSPIKTISHGLGDITKSLLKGFTVSTYKEAQGELYDEVGSIEYEAHKVIEPKLKEKFNEKEGGVM